MLRPLGSVFEPRHKGFLFEAPTAHLPFKRLNGCLGSADFVRSLQLTPSYGGLSDFNRVLGHIIP